MTFLPVVHFEPFAIDMFMEYLQRNRRSADGSVGYLDIINLALNVIEQVELSSLQHKVQLLATDVLLYMQKNAQAWKV